MLLVLSSAGCSAIVDLEGRAVNGDEVAVGGSAACAVVDQGPIACWGSQFLVGRENADPLTRPAQIPGLDEMVDVRMGADFAFVVGWSGRLYCFGNNHQGQCGTQGQDFYYAPVQVEEPPFVKLTATGGTHACVTDLNDRLHCWGNNDYYQLTDLAEEGANNQRVVVPLGGGDGVLLIATGTSHTCAYTEASELYCWGLTMNGQTGTPADPEPPLPAPGGVPCQPTPYLVPDITLVEQIAAGGEHTCVLLDGGEVNCWGNNYSGQLGNPLPDGGPSARYPFQAPSGRTWRRIAAGAGHTCGIDQAFALYCWGDNRAGQLGLGDLHLETTSEPTQVLLPGEAYRISASGDHTCVTVGHYGKVYCWGRNDDGIIPGVMGGVGTPTLVTW